MTPQQPQHEKEVAALATNYERQGYIVHLRPAVEQIPVELNGYYPDLLAEKENEHLLV